MRYFRFFLFYILIPLAAVAVVAYSYTKAGEDTMQLCDHQYALCTSAKCIPQPGNPHQAMCFCDVQKGKSMATKSCNRLRPSVDQHGIRTIYSTFSLEQLKKGARVMKCPSGTPWTWCLNKKCTIDPLNPTKALCICDVLRTEEWITFSTDCYTGHCNQGYLSGARLTDLKAGNEFMIKELGLEKDPVKWCPINSH